MLSAEVVEWIMKGGLVGFLIYAWLSEKGRADKERERNEVLARESITQAVKIEATLDKIATILTGRAL